jgi:hypothetical protein
LKESEKYNLIYSILRRLNTKQENRNDLVLLSIAKKLEDGYEKYGKSIPKEDGRDWKKETLYEVFDAMVYIVNYLLNIEEDENKIDKAVLTKLERQYMIELLKKALHNNNLDKDTIEVNNSILKKIGG